MPDIKNAGALAGFIRWGNPHHGLLDGATLGDGMAHTALATYKQRINLFITPAIKHVVPGHVAADLPVAAPGAVWLDYSILAGMRRTTYGTNLFASAPGHIKWVVSFGAGDSWLCASTASAVSADAGGGSASITLGLTRLGYMGTPPDGLTTLSLPSNVLDPCGQPSFSGDIDDFPSSLLRLIPLDISEDGQRVIFGIMKLDLTYEGYGAPRGLLLLELTKTTATLSLLKSRAQMLVSVTESFTESSTGGQAEADYSCTVPRVLTIPEQDTSSAITTTASNTIGAYFDNDGEIEYLNLQIVTVDSYTFHFDAYTRTCSTCSFGSLSDCVLDDQTYGRSDVYQSSESVVITNSAGTVASATALQVLEKISTIVVLSSVSTITTTDTSELSESTISGRVNYSSSVINHDPVSGGLADPPGESSVSHRYPNFVRYVVGTVIRAPYEYNNTLGVFPVSQIGLGGMIGHFSNFSLETSIFTARHGVGGYTAAADSAVISVHPDTGELASKTGAWADDAVPSFGWV